MQAARGTPVGPDEPLDGAASAGETTATADAAQGSPPLRRGTLRAWLAFVALAGGLYVLDVVTKVLAVEHLKGQPDVPLLGDVLVLHYTTNPGAAFSTGTEYTPVITTIAIVAVVVVAWLSRRLRSTGWVLALGFLMAGIAGNLTDRMLREPGPFRGHVIDFLMLPNWPVFNIADICINVGAGIVLLQAFRGVRIDGEREPGREPRRRRADAVDATEES